MLTYFADSCHLLLDVGALPEGNLVSVVVRNFGDETAEEWSKRSPTLDGGERLLELGGLIIDCETGEEFLNRL